MLQLELTADELEQQVRDLIVATLGLTGSECEGDIAQATCARWTSLRHTVLMMAIEERFSFSLSMDEMRSMTSLGSIVRVLLHGVEDDAQPAPDLAPPALEENPGRPSTETSANNFAQLPRPLVDYIERPGSTLRKLVHWANARWQLRRCSTVGAYARVVGRLRVVRSRNAEISIGSRVYMRSHFADSVLCALGEGRLEIGDRTVLNYGVDIAATRLVRIGKDCRIGTHVMILDNNFHERSNRNALPSGEPVVIGDNVWIGNRATVLPGVKIGDYAIVGAGAVVLADVPAHSLVLGNPARVVEKLPSSA